MKLISYEASDGTKVEYLENEGFILPIDGYKITSSIDDSDKIDITLRVETLEAGQFSTNYLLNQEIRKKYEQFC